MSEPLTAAEAKALVDYCTEIFTSTEGAEICQESKAWAFLHTEGYSYDAPPDRDVWRCSLAVAFYAGMKWQRRAN